MYAIVIRLLFHFLNIANIRLVTRNPPAILMAAISTATAPRIVVRFKFGRKLEHSADEDDAADGVGDAH